MTLPSARRSLLFTLAGACFAVLATANGAGYRYGTSDQAFYVPVITRAADSTLFPRDGALIDAEGRLMLLDEILAALVVATGLPLEQVFLLGYLVSCGLLWAGLMLIGTRIYRSWWTIAALGAAFAMRHRIPRTSANSFEPYFHPRMLAFALGALAVAAVLRRRPWAAIALVGVAAVIHITTALWYAVLIGVALAVLDPRWRRVVMAGAAAAAAVLVIAVMGGPLQGALQVMDDTWRQAVASKDSLFATAWPVWAWAANLGVLGLLWCAHAARRRRGDATTEDAALVWGATALVALFIVTLPFVAAGVSLVVQFQVPRVFWLVDFIALVYVIAILAESRTTGVRAAVVAVILAVSAARGAYIMLVERPERALFEVGLADSPWEEAMRWLRAQPKDVHVLADPGHAWKYATSVRVSAERDVLLEEVKDSALAIYSRDAAVRFVERVDAIGNFGDMTAEHGLMLAQRYDLDFLVTENDLALPEAYRNGQFRIYRLR